MAIYYVQSNHIIADRCSLPYKSSNNVSMFDTNINLNNILTIFIPNPILKTNLSELTASQQFGYDRYVSRGLQYKPIFLLYNKFYQN